MASIVLSIIPIVDVNILFVIKSVKLTSSFTLVTVAPSEPVHIGVVGYEPSSSWAKNINTSSPLVASFNPICPDVLLLSDVTSYLYHPSTNSVPSLTTVQSLLQSEIEILPVPVIRLTQIEFA